MADFTAKPNDTNTPFSNESAELSEFNQSFNNRFNEQFNKESL